MSTGRKLYVCLRCGRQFSKEDMEYITGVKCPYCGYRIILKTRSPSAKKIRAR